MVVVAVVMVLVVVLWWWWLVRVAGPRQVSELTGKLSEVLSSALGSLTRYDGQEWKYSKLQMAQFISNSN